MSDPQRLHDLKRGDTWSFAFIWKSLRCDGEGNPIDDELNPIPPTGTDADGNPIYDESLFKYDIIDLTGCTARMHLNRSGETVLDINTGSGMLVIDGPAGKVSGSVTGGITKNFETRDHKGDLELTFPDSTIQSTQTFILPVLKDETVAED